MQATVCARHKQSLGSLQRQLTQAANVPALKANSSLVHSNCLWSFSSLQHAAEIVQANDVEKSLRMVISFGGVNQKNFWSALQERLEPAMKKV